MSAPKPAVIIDVDGTVFNCEHRQHHVTKDPKDWEAFFAEIPGDTVIEPIRFIIEALDRRDDIHILLASGRGEEHRAVTEKQFEDAKIPYDALYMRPLLDRRDDPIVKKEILWQILADGYTPLFAIDDRKRVIDMWKAEGIFVLAVNGGADF